jgi:FkbM family methyltransferase
MEESVDLRMSLALRRVLGRGITIRTVLDLGAAKGDWTRVMQEVMPAEHYHLLEARESFRPDLEALCAADRRFSFTLSAVADHDGECYLFTPDDNPYGGWAANRQLLPDMKPVPCVCLDGEMKRLGLRGPFAIKFDIHANEMEVLAGAEEVLRQTELVIFEMLFWADDGLRVPRYLTKLHELGFWLVDMADPLRRARDECLWQVDMLFVKKSRPEAQYRGWT